MSSLAFIAVRTVELLQTLDVTEGPGAHDRLFVISPGMMPQRSHYSPKVIMRCVPMWKLAVPGCATLRAHFISVDPCPSVVL